MNKHDSEIIEKLREEIYLSNMRNIILLSKIQDLKGSILTFARPRPEEGDFSVEIVDPTLLETKSVDKRYNRNFQLDLCFQSYASQEEVFLELEFLINSSLSGYNVAIFAYGQTGSGKTYTTIGDQNSPGIIYQIIKKFKSLSAMPNYEKIKIKISMIEVYNEDIYDLLSKSSTRKKLEFNTNAGFESLNCEYIEIDSVKSSENCVKYGMRNRTTASTDVNEHSSRSHCIITLLIEMKERDTEKIKSFGKITIIDLAGSERVSHSQVVGQRLIEAQYINKSLSSLGNVIKALGEKQSHIPYRDSVLTLLLKDSISNKSKIIMIVTIRMVSEYINETYSSLLFAERVHSIKIGKIKNGGQMNKVSNEIKILNDKMLLLKEENSRLVKEIEQFNKNKSIGIIKAREMFKTKEVEYQYIIKESQQQINQLKEENKKLLLNQRTPEKKKILNVKGKQNETKIQKMRENFDMKEKGYQLKIGNYKSRISIPINHSTKMPPSKSTNRSIGYNITPSLIRQGYSTTVNRRMNGNKQSLSINQVKGNNLSPSKQSYSQIRPFMSLYELTSKIVINQEDSIIESESTPSLSQSVHNKSQDRPECKDVRISTRDAFELKKNALSRTCSERSQQFYLNQNANVDVTRRSKSKAYITPSLEEIKEVVLISKEKSSHIQIKKPFRGPKKIKI